MGYRDETEMLRARVAELEAQLAASEAETARLRSFGEKDRSLPAHIFGAPLILSEERTLDGALDDAGREAIIDVLRERYGAVGRTTLSKSTGTFTWRCGPPAIARTVELTARTVRSGSGVRTQVRVVERIGQIAGGLFGGIVGGVGAGVGFGVGIPLAATLSPFLLALVPVPGLIAWLAVRAGYRALADRKARELRATLDALPDAVAQASIPSTRVDESLATDDEDEEDEVAEEAPRVSRRA